MVSWLYYGAFYLILSSIWQSIKTVAWLWSNICILYTLYLLYNIGSRRPWRLQISSYWRFPWILTLAVFVFLELNCLHEICIQEVYLHFQAVIRAYIYMYGKSIDIYMRNTSWFFLLFIKHIVWTFFSRMSKYLWFFLYKLIKSNIWTMFYMKQVNEKIFDIFP